VRICDRASSLDIDRFNTSFLKRGIGGAGQIGLKSLFQTKTTFENDMELMNTNKSYFLILMLVAGVAIWWFLRADAADDQTGNDKNRLNTSVVPRPARSGEANSENAPVASKRSIREAPKQETADATDEMPQPSLESMKDIQSQAIKMLAAQKRAKFQQRIEKLAEALGLTDVQKSGLQSWLDERIAKIESIDSEDDGDLIKLLTNQALEEQLLTSLTAEQRTAFDEFKTRETQSRVDAAALKSLSQMQGVIEFEGNQRDAVYQILNDAAAARIKKEDESPDMISLNGLGIDLDPYDLGLQDAMKEASLKSRTSWDEADRKQMAENFRALIDQRIDDKVDQMRPVLNENQLEQYRAELQSKGTGILGGAMMDLESGGSGVHSIVIPAN